MRQYGNTFFLCIGLLIHSASFAESNAAPNPPAQLTKHAQRYVGWFNEAAAEFNVPAELLQAIAFAETRWTPHVPKGLSKKTDEPVVEFEMHAGDQPPVYGIMALRDDNYFGHSLVQAAGLIGQSPEVLKTDTHQNIRGAAALLSKLGDGRTRASLLADWEDALAKYSGIPQRDIAQMYSYEILNGIKVGRASDRYKVDRREVDLERKYGKTRLNELSSPTVKVPLNDKPAQ